MDIVTYALAKKYTNSAVETTSKLDFEVVDALPTTGINTGKIYLVREDSSLEDVFSEYLYVNGNWELLGSQKRMIDDEEYDIALAQELGFVNTMVGLSGSAIKVTEGIITYE